MRKLVQAAAALALVNALPLAALPFTGTEITIFDGSSQDKDWHRADEDQEVEIGMQHGQIWDLEGFWLQDNGDLAIVGGYDFKEGEGQFDAGDIFVDIDGDNIALGGRVVDGSVGNTPVKTTFGYDYVFDIDWAAQSYEIRELTDQSLTSEAWYTQNYSSSPWRYVGEDNSPDLATSVASGTFDYVADLKDSEAGYVGDPNATTGTHNVAYNFDLSWFINNQDIDSAYFHNTMGCGNDNLMGYAQGITTRTNVAEPSSIALLALGVFGLGMLRRKA
ncbi:PEP-CTERM sorting domain-containing protein [Oceanicoccus sagamiensis]|uniref:Ice-binding protein C-terminal domain-containing protein n=1 Tax=Oceanicoccus sagamiensis TaxID=716816 RepID=A0A1X9N915_9GAMM|nr:PEP-CTERM sorting domain-containing protein [Oceanicoccus sagamiensis]ARN73671.1 hypothetical protein BST96_05790 [Oceanicoccus sagamiensis]